MQLCVYIKLLAALKDETKDISPTDGRSKCDALAYHYSQSSYSKQYVYLKTNIIMNVHFNV